MSTRVLVVEDEAITRFMMTEMCDELGYRCKTAANGEQVLEVLERDPDIADVILMDIHMPKLSGDDVTRRIRQADTDPPKNVFILAVTADQDWHDLERCRAAGFNGVIPKPVSLRSIDAAIQVLR